MKNFPNILIGLALAAMPVGAVAQSAASGTVGSPASTQAGQIAGRDASGNLRVPRVDSSGNLSIASTGSGATADQAQGAGANGAPVTGNPVLVAGSDGTTTRTLRTSSAGDVFVVGSLAGAVAHDAVDSGSPIKIGGYASATAPTAVSAAADRVNAWYSLTGMASGFVAASLSLPDGATTTAAGLYDGVGNARALWTYPVLSNGTGYYHQRGDASGAVVQPYALTGSRWQYAGITGGIVDTSDVAIAAAGGASIRNYLTAIQFANTGTASEIVVKDGSTVIWRGYAPATTGTQQSVEFPVALKGTANTALNVAMITTASATRVSAQGYTAP